MSTFVELVNDLILESAVSGSSVTTLEGTLPGEIARLKKWVKDSWNEIQISKPNYWGFLFVQSSMVVPVNASVLQPPEYAAGEVAEWNYDSFRMSDPGKARKDSYPLIYHDYFWWRDHEGLDMTVPRKPQSITIDYTNEALIIAPASDDVRTLYFDYWRTPQELVEDDDVPIMPKQFHQLIVGKALERYGQHESAPEVIVKANKIISRIEPLLGIDQGVGITTQGLVWY